MAERIHFEVIDGGLGRPWLRYGLLERAARSAARREVQVLAFGLGPTEVRLVLEGGEEEVRNTVRGLKVGTIREVRAWGGRLCWGPVVRQPVGELGEAVAWAHLAPVDGGTPGPLATPWSSHRDLLGFRTATFYDPAVLDGRVDPHEIHRLCGGEPLPDGWPPPGGRESLSVLLRLAGAVLGVLPADRRCFRLFVHLARARGWGTSDLARALTLTTRRIRQLACLDEPLLPVAMTALGDPRLCRVP